MRWYKEQYPDTNEYVIVTVSDIQDDKAIVTLDEYDNIESWINWNQISNKRVKYIRHYLTVNKQYVMKTTNVDVVKGYIDLTRRDIDTNEIESLMNDYKKNKKIIGMIKHLNIISKIPEDVLYSNIVWKLFEFDNPTEYLQSIENNNSLLNIFDISDELKTSFLDIIHKNFEVMPTTLSYQFELSCYNEKGVNAIIEALSQAKNINQNIDITLLSTPIYSIKMTSIDIDNMTKIMQEALNSIENNIKLNGGTFKLISN